MFPGLGFYAVAASGEAGPASLNLSNLHAWWDASDAGTLTTSTGSVSQWQDKSGNGFHLGGASGSNRPTQTTVGGKAAVAFAAASAQRLTNTAAATGLRNRQIYTVAGVFLHPTGGRQDMCIKWGAQTQARTGASRSATDMEDYDNGDGRQDFDFRRNSTTTQTYVQNLRAHPSYYDGIARVFVMTGTSSQLLQAISGTETSVASTTTLPGDLDMFSLGCGYWNNVPFRHANVTCCEMAIWLGDHWASRNSIRTAWQNKWGAS